MVTLDNNNIAEVYMWSEDLRFHDYRTWRGVWIICVSHILATAADGQELPTGWPELARCVSAFKYVPESNSWTRDVTTPKVMIGCDNTSGAGGVPAFMMPNSAHIFVVFYTNNVPLSPPMLQVYWWRPDFDRMPIPNSIVLRVWDRPTSPEYFFRTLSVWIGGRGAPWVPDGGT